MCCMHREDSYDDDTCDIEIHRVDMSWICHVTYVPSPALYFFGHRGFDGSTRSTGGDQRYQRCSASDSTKHRMHSLVGRCWQECHMIHVFDHNLIIIWSVVHCHILTLMAVSTRLDLLWSVFDWSDWTPEVYVRCATGCSESSRGPAWPVFYRSPNWTCKQQLNNHVKRQSLNTSNYSWTGETCWSQRETSETYGILLAYLALRSNTPSNLFVKPCDRRLSFSFVWNKSFYI